MITTYQDTYASDTHKDAKDLCDMVANAKEGKRDDDHGDDCEEVDQLCRQDGGISVGKHGEIVTFNVEEGKDDVLPPIFEQKPTIALKPVAVKGVGGVDDIEQDIHEESLKGGDGSALCDE